MVPNYTLVLPTYALLKGVLIPPNHTRRYSFRDNGIRTLSSYRSFPKSLCDLSFILRILRRYAVDRDYCVSTFQLTRYNSVFPTSRHIDRANDFYRGIGYKG